MLFYVHLIFRRCVYYLYVGNSSLSSPFAIVFVNASSNRQVLTFINIVVKRFSSLFFNTRANCILVVNDNTHSSCNVVTIVLFQYLAFSIAVPTAYS